MTRAITTLFLSTLFFCSVFSQERILLAADNQVIEINRDGKVLEIYKIPEQNGVYDAWRLPDGGLVYIHRLGLVLLDARKNIMMEHKAVAGTKGAEINSVEVLEGGAKFAVMESGINKILIIDRKDMVLDSISLPDLSGEPIHFRYRMIRKIKGEDAYWAAQNNPKTLIKENSKSGEIMKNISIDPYLKPTTKKHRCYAVIMAPDKSLYTSTSEGCQLIHIAEDGGLIDFWTAEELNISTRYFDGMQLLKNGNLMVTCSDFHLKSADENKDVLVEISPEGKVVWRLSRQQIVDQIEGYVDSKSNIEELRITNVHVYEGSKLKECLEVTR